MTELDPVIAAARKKMPASSAGMMRNGECFTWTHTALNCSYESPW
jgi:hypothetical protein